MPVFLINLDSAPDRWTFIQEAFARTRLPIRQVPAMAGTMTFARGKPVFKLKSRASHSMCHPNIHLVTLPGQAPHGVPSSL